MIVRVFQLVVEMGAFAGVETALRFDTVENVMIKVIVTQRGGQPDCWYIDEISGIAVTAGRICYRSSRDAVTIARWQHPCADIAIEE